MIEDAFIRLYAHDFVQFSGRNELGQDVTAGVAKRMADARSHAEVMDAHKGSDHLASLISRLREEANHFSGRMMLKGADPAEAARRHRRFLNGIADSLSQSVEAVPPASGSARASRAGLTLRPVRRTVASGIIS